MTESETPPAAPVSRMSRILAWVVVTGLLGVVVWVAVQSGGRSMPHSADPAVTVGSDGAEVAGHGVDPARLGLSGVGLTISADSGLLKASPGALLDYACIERSGDEMTTHDLLGKFLVVDFIFTNCPGVCVPMAARMKELQDATSEADDLQLVSFTVDPRRDSPEVLSKYADRVGADGDRWVFFFAQKARVHDIAYNGMKLGAEKDPIVHSPKFVLLDTKGKVRAYYAPLEDEGWLEKLLGDLATLRGELP